MKTIVIKNGTVITGGKRSAFKSDVVIKDDRITAIERNVSLSRKNGAVVIDATGKVVCPGFIDPHSHADMTIYRKRHPELLEPLIRQGITTFVGGNCGLAMAPFSDTAGHYESQKTFLEGFTARSLDDDVSWQDMNGFMECVEERGLALNCAMLAPHGLIRIDEMGMDMRRATNEEIGRMSLELEKCMDAGCIGMSTGLQYMPGLQSETRELVKLGKILKKYDGIYTSHLRTYMKDLPRAVDELITVARENDIRAQVSHILWVPDHGVLAPLVQAFARTLIKLSKYWTAPIKIDGDMERELRKLARARRKGVEVRADLMPSSTTFTHLIAYLPPWVIQGSKQEIIAKARDPRIRRKILYDIENGDMVWPHTGRSSWSLNVLKLLGWDSTIIMSVVTPENRHLEGKTLAQVGRERGKHPFDAMCDLLIEETGQILVFSALGEPEDNFTERSMFAALKDPDVAISTDTILLGIGTPSFLFFGAFPRFFGRYVRDMKLLDLETAVRKVTSTPAEQFNLKQRGRLREGYFADVVVFDPKTIAPNCTFTKPKGTPSGIEHVFINGRHALNGPNLDLSTLPGRLLRNI